jgi:hypothetical protein
MLSKKDKDEIRAVIRDEISAALTRRVRVERGPRKQGDPQEKRVVEEEWNLIDYIAGYMPYVEGAIRGVQEDVDNAKNDVTRMAKVLLTLEQSFYQIAALADGIRESGLLEGSQRLMISAGEREDHASDS